MADNLTRWAEQQMVALLAIGVDLVESTRSVEWVLKHLPTGADPATYIFTGAELWESPDTAANIADSRADWYSQSEVPGKFKRLLDARRIDA